jgi:hypothetical protein
MAVQIVQKVNATEQPNSCISDRLANNGMYEGNASRKLYTTNGY